MITPCNFSKYTWKYPELTWRFIKCHKSCSSSVVTEKLSKLVMRILTLSLDLEDGNRERPKSWFVIWTRSFNKSTVYTKMILQQNLILSQKKVSIVNALFASFIINSKEFLNRSLYECKNITSLACSQNPEVQHWQRNIVGCLLQQLRIVHPNHAVLYY